MNRLPKLLLTLLPKWSIVMCQFSVYNQFIFFLFNFNISFFFWKNYQFFLISFSWSVRKNPLRCWKSLSSWRWFSCVRVHPRMSGTNRSTSQSVLKQKWHMGLRLRYPPWTLFVRYRRCSLQICWIETHSHQLLRRMQRNSSKSNWKSYHNHVDDKLINPFYPTSQISSIGLFRRGNERFSATYAWLAF